MCIGHQSIIKKLNRGKKHPLNKKYCKIRIYFIFSYLIPYHLIVNGQSPISITFYLRCVLCVCYFLAWIQHWNPNTEYFVQNFVRFVSIVQLKRINTKNRKIQLRLECTAPNRTMKMLKKTKKRTNNKERRTWIRQSNKVKTKTNQKEQNEKRVHCNTVCV